MGKSTKQLKQMEAIFVPNRRGSIEFAGVVEASRDSDCDIHGRRDSDGTIRISLATMDKPRKRSSLSKERDSSTSAKTSILTKRDSIGGNTSGGASKRDSIGNSSKRDSIGSTSKRDSSSSPFGNSYLSNYTILNRQSSVDRELGMNDAAIPRRRSSGGKSSSTPNR